MIGAVPTASIENVKMFIRDSCNDWNLENPKFCAFHKALVERYFEARNVQIDYAAKSIKAEIQVQGKQYTTINFTNLEFPTFLASCIRNDERSMQFYRSHMERLLI